jgi:hypothetical protein
MKRSVLIVFYILLFSQVNFAKDYYVSNLGNDKKGNGSKSKPFETIAKALSVIQADQNNTLHIGKGLFQVKSQLVVPSGVNFVGEGFEKTIIKCENYFDIETTSKKGADWQGAPSLDPEASETATFIFNGKNQAIKGINFDGDGKKTITLNPQLIFSFLIVCVFSIFV